MIEGHVKIFYFCEKYIKYSSFGPSILYNFKVSTLGFLGRQLFEQMKVASKRSLKVDGPPFRRENRATHKRNDLDMRHMITSNFLTGPKIGQPRLFWPITITFVFPFQDGGVLWTSGILELFNLNVNLRKDVFDFNFTAMLKSQFFVLFQGLIKGRFLSNFWTFWIQNFGF